MYTPQISGCFIVVTLACMPFSPSLAQDQSSRDQALIDAYTKGYSDGYNAGRSQGNPPLLSPSTQVFTTQKYTQFELPKAFLSVGDASNQTAFEIPDNWYVTPSTTGEAVIAKVTKDGTILPYVEKDNAFTTLPENQLPAWMSDPAVKQFIQALPKTEGGLTYIPVQPSAE